MPENSKKNKGHKHIISQAIEEIVHIFSGLGFSVAEGPEIETERYNFDVLNIPPNHPARDLWDTFWLKPESTGGTLLRTHTSPVQAHYMEEHETPIRIIAPGKVFRYEATDATHESQFHQLEGLMIDTDITLGIMRGILKKFFEEFLGTNIDLRLRPSYFPFVEPGVEIDMSCFKCEGKGGKCFLCKDTGWIEIMGAGMVHPTVLNELGINPRKHQGFAFGVGIDRLVMLKHGIDDIRLLYSGDLRLVNQF
jgi:phenylalanyl-tRNA synthetase alpha chain